MTQPLAVVLTRRAFSQVVGIDRWWRGPRRGAPTLFRDELTQTLQLLSSTPEVGTTPRDATLSGVRRVLLPRSGYHAYYRVQAHTVQVLAVWHAKRRPPKL